MTETDPIARLTRERDEARERAAAWTETARMYANNEAYFRGLIVRALERVPAAYLADDGSRMEDVLCAKLPELYAAAEAKAERLESALREIADECDGPAHGIARAALGEEGSHV